MLQDWQTKCIKLFVNSDVIEEWARIATALNAIGGGGKGSEDTATEMMALLEAELKTVHDAMGKKFRCARARMHACTRDVRRASAGRRQQCRRRRGRRRPGALVRRPRGVEAECWAMLIDGVSSADPVRAL